MHLLMRRRLQWSPVLIWGRRQASVAEALQKKQAAGQDCDTTCAGCYLSRGGCAAGEQAPQAVDGKPCAPSNRDGGRLAASLCIGGALDLCRRLRLEGVPAVTRGFHLRHARGEGAAAGGLAAAHRWDCIASGELRALLAPSRRTDTVRCRSLRPRGKGVAAARPASQADHSRRATCNAVLRFIAMRGLKTRMRLARESLMKQRRRTDEGGRACCANLHTQGQHIHHHLLTCWSRSTHTRRATSWVNPREGASTFHITPMHSTHRCR